MLKAREITAGALAERAEAGIKVRQPLASLTIKDKLGKEFLDLIKDEVNVKKIIIGKQLKLDTKITKELEQEGRDRDWIRMVNAERKKMGLTPKDVVVAETTERVFDVEKAKKEVKAKEIILKDKGPRILLKKIK